MECAPNYFPDYREHLSEDIGVPSHPKQKYKATNKKQQ